MSEKLQAAQYALRLSHPANPPAAKAASPAPGRPSRTTSDFSRELAASTGTRGGAQAGAARVGPGLGAADLAMQAYHRQPALRVRFSAAQFATLAGKLMQPAGAALADLRT